MWTEQVRSMIGTGILETLYMTVVSTVFGYLFGLPMGILLCICLLYTSPSPRDTR